MKVVIITGGTGFVGLNLVEKLLKENCYIYMLVRPNSANKEKIPKSEKIFLVEGSMDDINILKSVKYISNPNFFFHLAWQGTIDNFEEQYKNVEFTLNAVKVAKAIGCKRFICTGSQAEYGIYNCKITENLNTLPVNSYGSSKVAACNLSKDLARHLEIEWIWGRIFSVYGKYEPSRTMIWYLMQCFKKNISPLLTKCEQNWDYLYSSDTAEALWSLANYGIDGEIYNIANGNYKKLKIFVEKIKKVYNSNVIVRYEKELDQIITLAPSIDKIVRDTGWKPRVDFIEGINLMVTR